MKVGSLYASSLSIQNSLRNMDNASSNSLKRLATGLRINSAADDASGLFIANSLLSQSSSLQQAYQNANEAIGIAQIADKAIDEQITIMDVIKTKLIQSASDSQSSKSRKALQLDINRLLESFNSIANSTSYHSHSLLSGAYTNKKFQVGADSNQTANLSIQSTALNAIGTTSYTQSKLLPTVSMDPFGSTAIQLNGVQLKEVPIGYRAGEGLGKLSKVINTSSSETGILASYIVEHQYSNPNQALVGGTTPSDFSINDILIGSVTFEDRDNTGNLISAINAKTSETGIKAYTDIIGGLILSSPDGRAIKLSTNFSSELGSLKIATSNSSTDNNQYDPPNLQVERYAISGTIESGDIYTLGSISYSVQPSDTNIDDIIDKLVIGLNGATAPGISGTPISGAVAARDSSGVLKLSATTQDTKFISPSVSTINIPSINDQSLVFNSIVQNNIAETPHQNEVKKSVLYSLSDTYTTAVEEGDTYTLNIAGISTSYTTLVSDLSPLDVINGLFNKLTTNPNLSVYTFSLVNTDQIQITGASDFSVSTNQTESTQQTIDFSVASNTQDNNQASNWGRAAATLVLTNSTLDTNNVFTTGDTISFHFSPTVSIDYTVLASDIDSSDATGAKTNYNVFKKLQDLINNDVRTSGFVTAQTNLEENAPYTYYYDNSIPYDSSLNLSVNNNIAVLDIYQNAPDSWTPLASSQNFTLTGTVSSNLYSLNTSGYDRASVIHETPIVASIPEITTFNFSINQIIPGTKIHIGFDTGYTGSDFSYTIKATDNTIDDIVNGINASISKVNKVDTSGNITLVPMASLVNNNDGTLTMTSYTTLYTSVMTLNDANIYNFGRYNDTTYSKSPYMSYASTTIENTMYTEDLVMLAQNVTTIVPYSPEIPYQTPQQQILKYTLSGTIEENDKYTLGGITYTVGASDTSLSNIVDKLVLGLNGGSAAGITGTALNGIIASKDINDDILLSADIAGIPFAAPNATASDFAINDQSIIKLPIIASQSSSEFGGMITVGKLKLVANATGARIEIAGSGLEYIGMSSNDTPDQWVKNLLDINALDKKSNKGSVSTMPIQESIDICYSAIEQLGAIRSDIGSFQNQLQSTMSNLNVSKVNLKNAESQIRDVDFAIESAEFSKKNILIQSGTYALTQSNIRYQQIMRLLK